VTTHGAPYGPRAAGLLGRVCLWKQGEPNYTEKSFTHPSESLYGVLFLPVSLSARG